MNRVAADTSHNDTKPANTNALACTIHPSTTIPKPKTHAHKPRFKYPYHCRTRAPRCRMERRTGGTEAPWPLNHNMCTTKTRNKERESCPAVPCRVSVMEHTHAVWIEWLTAPAHPRSSLLRQQTDRQGERESDRHARSTRSRRKNANNDNNDDNNNDDDDGGGERRTTNDKRRTTNLQK